MTEQYFDEEEGAEIDREGDNRKMLGGKDESSLVLDIRKTLKNYSNKGLLYY